MIKQWINDKPFDAYVNHVKGIKIQRIDKLLTKARFLNA